eukprot:SAG22_NODE_7614_length_723_cov_1.418269_2_plen_127_part_01
MRIIRFTAEEDGLSHYGIEPPGGPVPGSAVQVLGPADVAASGAKARYPEWDLPDLVAAGPGAAASSTALTIKKVLLPMVPSNVLCIGLNYAAHAAEGAKKRGIPLVLPELPVTFMKATSSLLSYMGD